MELFTVGDTLLVRDAGRGAMRLVGAHGLIARWSMLPTPSTESRDDDDAVEWVEGFAVLEDPPRIAMVLGTGALRERSLFEGEQQLVIALFHSLDPCVHCSRHCRRLVWPKSIREPPAVLPPRPD